MKRGHAQAGLVRLYAAERSIPLRTAQYHAQKQTSDWVAFLARTGGEALKAREPTKEQAVALVGHLQTVEQKGIVAHVSPPAMAKPEHLRTPEEYAECEAWTGLVLANEQRDQALRAGSAVNAVGFVNLAATQLKSYHQARASRVKAEMDSGRLKPVAAWVSFKTTLSQIAGQLKALPSIASEANPEHPHVAQAAIMNWLQGTFGPAVENMMAEINREMAA